MNVSSWSIKNPISAVMLFVILTTAGLLSFAAMKIQRFPDIELPNIIVSASLRGATPIQLEADVARKLENAIANVQGLKHTYTKIQQDGVTITAEFQLEKSLQEALEEVRSAVQQVRADLPSEMRDPVVNKMSFAGSSPILAYTVAAPGMDTESLSWFVDQTIIKTLAGAKGVGSVARVGGVQREIQVVLDPLHLQALSVSAVDVTRALQLSQTDASAGRFDLGDQEQSIRALGTVKDAQALAQLSLLLSNGQRIRLGQIADIHDTIAEPQSAALLNGEPVVGFEITRALGASEIEVGAAVNAALTQLSKDYPYIQINLAFDFVEPVYWEYNASMELLYEGALLAVLVVWLFLRDWRATIISATALPLSVIPAFLGMFYLGFTVNTVTLLALSLVVGILVDDAIVEVENIVRHLRMGKSPYQAAMDATNEIGLAVIATTFTLVAVFLPTAFMSGIPGRFFKQFGWTAAIAVLASLLVARALTPMMAAYLLRPKPLSSNQSSRFGRGYLAMVAFCLRNRVLTIVGAIVFFVSSIMIIPFLPKGFLPEDDLSQTQVNIELPPGTPLEKTIAYAELAREKISPIEHVLSIYTTIGSGLAGSDPFMSAGLQEYRKATLTITLSPRTERTVRKQVIESQIRQAIGDIPGAITRVGLGASNQNYMLVLTSDDGNALQQAARNVETELRTIPGLGAVFSSASLVKPELTLAIDSTRAAALGVNTESIAQTLRVATLGDFDINLPKLNTPERQVPIRVKFPDSVREDFQQISRLYVPNIKPGAPPVILGNVAQVRMGSAPANLNRYDRSRNITFEIEPTGLPLGDIALAVQNMQSIKNLPSSVQRREIGDAEAQAELFASFQLAMLIGVLCIYIVLVLLFKDFLQPITILFALPLCLGGAFVALLLTGKSFSMPSLIGLVMLMGIATKNSILLVEYAIMAVTHKGLSKREAILDACHKRARPIIMTTIAMSAGMLPVAIGWGAADPSFRSPMAIAVIGGLMTSTFLSLLVIPVVYDIVDGFKRSMVRLWGFRKKTAHTKDQFAMR